MCFTVWSCIKWSFFVAVYFGMIFIITIKAKNWEFERYHALILYTAATIPYCLCCNCVSVSREIVRRRNERQYNTPVYDNNGYGGGGGGGVNQKEYMKWKKERRAHTWNR